MVAESLVFTKSPLFPLVSHFTQELCLRMASVLLIMLIRLYN